MKSVLENKSIRTFNVEVIIIFFFGVLIQSCSKDNFELTDNNNSSPIPNVFDTNVNFSSKVTNPYDFIGKYHNEGLQFVIDEYLKSPKLKAEQELELQVKDLVMSYMEGNDIFASSGIKTTKTLSSLSIMDKIKLKQIRLKNDDLFSKKDQQIHFNKLMNVFNNKIVSPQILIDFINEVEYNIIMDKKLTEEEQTELLITTAVAKYSSMFWIEVFLNNDNRERGIRLKDGSESGWNFSDWWQNTFMPKAEEVVKSDFAGAAAGAVMGAIAGATGGSFVAPGPGTVTVAVTGAIVGGAQGAIGSSAIAGILVTFW